MNQSSLPCFLSVLLADKCGQKGYAPFQLRIEDLPVVAEGA